MVSKNNLKRKLEQDSKRVPHYGIRKLSIGVASVLLGVTLYFSAGSTVLADTTTVPTTPEETNVTSSNDNANSSSAVLTTNSSAATSQSTADSSAASSIANDSSSTALTSATDSSATSAASSTAPVSSTGSTTSESNATSADFSAASSASSANVASDDGIATLGNVTAQIMAVDVTSADGSTVDSSTATTSPVTSDSNKGISTQSEEDVDSGALTASLSDGATISISRNTIGATGDTSAVIITFDISNYQAGDTYNIAIPKGTYTITADGNALPPLYGTTTVTNNADSTVVSDTFTSTGAHTLQQVFTLTPSNNYQGQATPEDFIGEILKQITLTKLGSDGTTESTSLDLTQIVTPEMDPIFARTTPASSSYYLLPNVDYTYSLTINETTGVAQGISYPSNRINSAVNTSTTITIPVPEGFILDATQTALANNFTDGTTITQPNGKSGNIIISVPKGAGSQNYTFTDPYRIVGYYDVNQPATDTTVTAKAPITVNQIITKADGSTYHLVKETGPWSDTLMGTTTDSTALAIKVSAYPYVSSRQVPSDVDTSAPLNSFGFSNPTSENLTNVQIQLTFPDGFQISQIKTPVDAVYLPGTTSYGYQITYTDGTTVSGTVTAGDSVTAESGKYIQSIIFTPNLIAAGAQAGGSSLQDKTLMFEAYGTIAGSLSNGTAVTDGEEFTSTITASYSDNGKTVSSTSTARQTVTQRVTSLGAFTWQSSLIHPGTSNAGYMSVVTDGNANDTTHVLYEPTFYYVLPEYTYYSGKFDNPISDVTPTITTFMVGDRQVVKIDCSGTGAQIPTNNASRNQIYLTNSPLAPIGSYDWEIYVYSPTTKMSNPTASANRNWTSADTGGQSNNVYLVGNGSWTISMVHLASINTAAQGNTNEMPVINGISNDKGSAAMSFDFNVTNTTEDLSNATAIVTLSDTSTANFQLTGPVTLADGGNATVLYSTSHYTDTNTVRGAQPELSGFVAANQITDWSTVKAIAIKLGSMALNSASQTYKISGEDSTVAEDAGKSIKLATYLYSEQLKPASAGEAGNATIQVTGKSTVTARVAYQDTADNTEYLELPDLTKIYTDNASTMTQADFALTDADKASINNLISQLNAAANGQYTYELVETPTIVNGGKTWQTDAPNGTASFASATNANDGAVKYYYNGDIVQYRLAKFQNITYNIIDDTTGNTLVSDALLGSGEQNTDVDSGLTTTYDQTIQSYLDQGYVLVSDDAVPANYGTANQTLNVHLVHGTITQTNTASVTRTVNYYDKTTGGVMPSSLAPTRTQTASFTNTEVTDAVTHAKLGYNTTGDYTTYRDLNSNDVKVYKVDTTDESQAWQSTDATLAAITNPVLTSNGYEPATDESGTALPSEAAETVTATDTDQTINVYYTEHVIPVDSSTTATAGQLVSDGSSYVWPTNNFDPSAYRSTSTRIISYQYANGTQADDPVTETVTFNQTGTMNLVTGEVTPKNDWTATSSTITQNSQTTNNDQNNQYGAVTSPTITGYTPSQTTVAAAEAVQGSDGANVVVIYTADPQTITYTIYDETTGRDIATKQILGTGTSDANVSSDTATAYQNLIDQYNQNGYVVVSSDSLPDNYDHDDNTDQNVVITVAHKVATITSSTASADVPTNSVVQPADLEKTVGLTVNYQNSDGTAFAGTIPANATNQTVTLEGTAYVDAVTGQLTNQPTAAGIVDTANTATPAITWTTGTTDAVTSPAETGYHTTTSSIGPITVKVDNNASANSGLTSGDTVTLAKDTKTATITRTVTYAKDPTAEVVYVDQDNNNAVIPNTGSGTLIGTANQPINYSTSSTISALENEGYELVTNGFDPNGAAPNYGNDNTATQQYTVTMKHKTVTVDPDAPKTTSDALPDNPSHNYPAGVGESDLNKIVTRTINVHKPDGTVATTTQQVKLTRTATVDEVTGKVTYSDWTTGSWPVFTDIPILPGYTVGQTRVDAQNVTSNTSNATVNIYYIPHQQTIYYQIVDDTTGDVLTGDTPLVTGDSDSVVPASAQTDLATDIKAYTDQGYVLVGENEVPTRFDHDDGVNQIIIVHLAHGTKNVSQDKTVTRTINYVDSQTGQQLKPSVVQTVTFNQTGTKDLVTGQTTWNPTDPQSFASVDSPSINGYDAPSIAVIDGQTVNVDSNDTIVNVEYTKLQSDTNNIGDNNGSTSGNDSASQSKTTTITDGNGQVISGEAQPNKQAALPQTGNTHSELGVLGLLILDFAGLLGFRKKKED